MRKLFKKALACCLVAALALTCFVGAISVNAENATGSAIVTGITVTEGATEATVKVTLTSNDAEGIHAAIVTVSSNFGAIKSVVDADEYYVEGVETAQTDFFVDDGDINGNTFLVQARSNAVNDKEINLNVTFEAETAPVAGTYPVTITAGSVPAASWNEVVTEFTTLTGADIVVEAAKPEIELFVLGGANMTLGNELAMSFFIPKGNTTSLDNYVVIKKAYADDRGDKEIILQQGEWTSYNSKLYRVTFNGVAAKEMSDTISVTVYNKDGVQISETWTDSVATYATRVLSSTATSVSQEMKILAVDMLLYGAAAQNNFGYGTDNLASDVLTEEWRALATTGVELENSQIKGPNLYGSNLTLENSILMNFYFNNVTTDMKAIVTFTNYKGVEKSYEIAGELFKKSGTRYGPVIDEIVLADASQLVTVEIQDSEGNVIGSASDSVESYCARAINAKLDTNGLYAAIMNFATSAYNYLT